MAKEMEFFSFLMEQYAAYKGTTANKIIVNNTFILTNITKEIIILITAIKNSSGQ